MTSVTPYLTILLLAASTARATGPATELTAALDDLAHNVAPDRRATTRYLSHYNIAPNQHDEATAVLSFVLNSISRNSRIAHPVPVANTSGRLLRIDLNAYKLPPETWEALVSDNEPYWHITTEVLDPAANEKKKVYTDGGWLDLTAAARLRAMTQSGGALVRADWFITRAANPPHYYNLAGVPPKLDDWYANLGVDKKIIVALKANRGANLFRSGVTKKPRRISRYSGPTGGVWQTYDTFGDDPAKDPFRNPTFTGDYNASEHIAAKPNGLHLFALYNEKGERQDTVPDRLAKDDSDPLADGVLVPMISCVRCHVEDGLRPFTDDQTRLLAANVKLLAADENTAEEITAFYDQPTLARQTTRDREDYAAAVAKATSGSTPKEIAAALANLHRAYRDEQVEPTTAAAELGIRDLTALRASRDPVLLALAGGIPVHRQQWEQSYAEAAILRGRESFSQAKQISQSDPNAKKSPDPIALTTDH